MTDIMVPWPEMPGALVVARFAQVHGDGTDDDDRPDWIAPVGAELMFIPSITGPLVYDPTGAKIIVEMHSFRAVVDADGYAVAQDGGHPIRLAPTNDALMSRTGWQWTCSWEGGKVNFPAPSEGAINLADYIIAPPDNPVVEEWVARIPELVDTISSAGTTATDAATAAVTAQGLAEGARDAAATSADEAATSATESGSARDAAVTARQGAEAAQGVAESARDDAVHAKEVAESFGLTASAEHVSSDTPISVEVTGTAPTFNLDLNIPRGRDAYIESATPPADTEMLWLDTSTPSLPESGSPFELRGYGMPNGVVTAPTGTYYTDNVGTNGAWRWLKTSGTGNTGWTVIHGDTGWVDLTHTVELPIESGTLSIRRKEGAVWLRFDELKAPEDTQLAASTYLVSAPEGFRGGGGEPAGYVSASNNRSAQYRIAGLSGANRRRIVIAGRQQYSSTSVTVSNVWAANHPLSGTLMWNSDDPWPTTLPGTAV